MVFSVFHFNYHCENHGASYLLNNLIGKVGEVEHRIVGETPKRTDKKREKFFNG